VLSIIQTLILSIIEGVTEFLPISSTGHLVLVSSLLKIPQTEFVKSFEIIIQFGAILAVVFLYRYKLWNNFKLWKEIFIAFIPSVVIGFIAYNFIKQNLLSNSFVVVLSLFLGGIFIIFFEKAQTHKVHTRCVLGSTHRVWDYILIGIFQSFAMIPGVSRAMATIFGAMIVGMDRKKATEFSFLLAIPTMFGASILDLYKVKFAFSNTEFWILFLGFIGSFITALITVKWLIKYVQSNNFVCFGIYRIIVAILFLLFYL